MVQNIKKIRKILYKQKKFLLLNLYTFSLMATAMTAHAKETDPNNLYAGASKAFAESIPEIPVKENNQIALTAGITATLNDFLVDSLNDFGEMSEKSIREGNITSQKSNAIYYDFPCSDELQDHIFKMSEKYNVPHEIMMTIIHRESGGQWNTNGIISRTNDYGLPQINIFNAKYIKENLGYSMDEILYDPYKAIEAQAFILKTILNEYDYTDNIDYRNVFGTYNGWVNWEKNSASCDYAEGCMQIYEEKFGGISRKLN